MWPRRLNYRRPNKAEIPRRLKYRRPIETEIDGTVTLSCAQVGLCCQLRTKSATYVHNYFWRFCSIKYQTNLNVTSKKLKILHITFYRALILPSSIPCYIQSAIKTQMNLLICCCWADWAIRAVLNISEILIKYFFSYSHGKTPVICPSFNYITRSKTISRDWGTFP